MRLEPLAPGKLNTELLYIHDEITTLITRSQGPVQMMNSDGALLGPFPPMLHFPQFGIAALTFLRTLDTEATLPARLREVVILTVGGALGARFELYAHEIMGSVLGLSPAVIATLAAGGHPYGLNESETLAHDVTYALVTGHIIPESTYQHGIKLLTQQGMGELIFLVSGYCLIAMLLNGFDIPAPEGKEISIAHAST